MARIRVLSPVGLEAGEALRLPSLPVDLAGRTVGFLDNTKANFDHLVTQIGVLLRERYGVKEILHLRKANASTPAPAGLIAELTKQCDVVFAGSAD